MTLSTALLSIYQLRIVLRSISPLIWRRVFVGSDTALAHLHLILQIVFAWSDEHLYVTIFWAIQIPLPKHK
jgi:Plasmid pRiA4b ORF-3-like protein